MAFKAYYSLFESLVMSFSLTNAPVSLQAFINDTLNPFLDIFCTAILNEILINRNNIQEHMKYVWAVMNTPKEAQLYLKAE
jgi:hypothetical protein